jgi:hypothetical protein
MSITYTARVKLDAKYSPANMLHILKEGAAIDFVYYQYLYSKSPVIDLAKAVENFLATDPDSGDRLINIVFQDTNFFISFLKSDDEKLKVSMVAFGSPWCTDFRDNTRMVNLARYIRLLLQLCKDFVVLEVKTSEI